MNEEKKHGVIDKLWQELVEARRAAEQEKAERLAAKAERARYSPSASEAASDADEEQEDK